VRRERESQHLGVLLDVALVADTGEEDRHGSAPFSASKKGPVARSP
jgi:hypothetical protein